MPAQDTSQLKEKILFLLRTNGPSLPARIARETGLSILFASAFLSELFAEKKLKLSHMKVGSSPLYFLPGHESKLENFSQYLKSKEKDAFLLLKEKKFLKDAEQQPAIRVALRELKDFAVPFKKPDAPEIFWRYFTIPEAELPKSEIKAVEFKEQKIEIREPKKEEITSKEETLNIFETKLKKKPLKKPRIKAKKLSKKQDDKFFNKVKEFLAEKSVEILDIKSFSKNELVLKIRENEKEILLIAYNKKRLTEEDIVKAYKKASEAGLKYKLLSLGEMPSKLKNLITALKDLDKIEKISDNKNL